MYIRAKITSKKAIVDKHKGEKKPSRVWKAFHKNCSPYFWIDQTYYRSSQRGGFVEDHLTSSTSMKNKETLEVNEAKVRMKNSCGEFDEGVWERRERVEDGILVREREDRYDDEGGEYLRNEEGWGKCPSLASQWGSKPQKSFWWELRVVTLPPSSLRPLFPSHSTPRFSLALVALLFAVGRVIQVEQSRSYRSASCKFLPLALLPELSL